HEHAGQNNRADNDQQNLEIESFNFGFVCFLFQCAQSDYSTTQSQADAQPERKVPRAHTCCRSHRVFRSSKGETDPKRHEHDSGPEVLLISKLHVDEPLLQLIYGTLLEDRSRSRKPWRYRSKGADW